MKSKNIYSTSKDYKRLRQLLDKGLEVVCWADYRGFNQTKHYSNGKIIFD